MFDGPLPIAATFSKDPRMWAKAFMPDTVFGANGAYVFGYGDRRFLDWVSGLGAILLASSYPEFCQRVQTQLWNGVGFSLPHWLERQVADKLCHLLGPRVPGWSADGLGVRFGLSGSDACSMAVRLARAVTGRNRILSSGYHGWGDEFISVTPPAWGVTHPQYVESWDVKSLNWLDELAGSGELFAAVIIEVPMTPIPDVWSYVRQLCDRSGALLILDEVVTGLRWALGGAAEVYGIEPDIVCMGKALGNGIPISAIVGRKEYFEWFARTDPCFVSSTGFGNAISLAAADAVLDIWDQAGVDHLWRIGQALMDGLREIGYSIIGHPPRFLVEHNNISERTYFTLRLRDMGILANRPWLPNLAHTMADVDMTLKAAREIKAEMERLDVEALMAGQLPMVLFENR